MLLKKLLENILPKKDKYIFHSETISDDSQVRLIIEDIKSDGSISIELESFYNNFDFYQNLKVKKLGIEQQLRTMDENSKAYSQGHLQLTTIIKQEKELRANILELALTIEKMRDNEKRSELEIAFQKGQLRQIDDILPDDYLLEQFNKYLKNEEQIQQVSEFLKDNANEFRVKAEVTNLDYDRVDRFAMAIFYFEKGTRSAQVSRDRDFLATYQFKFGLFYYHNSKINDALPHFEKSLTLFDELAEKDPLKYVEDQAETINNIAAIHSRNHNFKEAIEYYDQAISMLEDMPTTEKQNHFLIALALTNKGNVLFKCNDFDNATVIFKRSVHLWEELHKLDPQFYKPRLANNYNSLGAVYKRNFKFKEAEKAYLRAFELRKELAETNPKKHELNFTITQTNLGAFYRTIGNFEKALKCYEGSIEIQERLIITNPQARKSLSETNNNLGVYYYHQKNNEKSKVAYNRAIEIREILARENPMEYLPDLAKSLLNVAISFASGQDFKTARPYFEKALRLYEGLAEENPSAFLPSLEMVHYNFAISLQYSGEIELAQQNYQRSLSIIEPLFAQNPQAHLRRLAITLTKMCTFYMDFFEPPKKKETVEMANRVLTLCTPENQKIYGLETEYKVAMKLLEACGVDAGK